jgi:hypothetical protein
MKLLTIITILAIVTGIADAVPRPQHVGRGHSLMKRKDKNNDDNDNNDDGGDLKPLCTADADGYGRLANGNQTPLLTQFAETFFRRPM